MRSSFVRVMIRLFRNDYCFANARTLEKREKASRDATTRNKEEYNGSDGGRDKKKQAARRKEEGVKRWRGRGTATYNVILTEITPSRTPRDNKFATLPRILE